VAIGWKKWIRYQHKNKKKKKKTISFSRIISVLLKGVWSQSRQAAGKKREDAVAGK
jgi:hypothetical protein